MRSKILSTEVDQPKSKLKFDFLSQSFGWTGRRACWVRCTRRRVRECREHRKSQCLQFLFEMRNRAELYPTHAQRARRLDIYLAIIHKQSFRCFHAQAIKSVLKDCRVRLDEPHFGGECPEIKILHPLEILQHIVPQVQRHVGRSE